MSGSLKLLLVFTLFCVKYHVTAQKMKDGVDPATQFFEEFHKAAHQQNKKALELLFSEQFAFFSCTGIMGKTEFIEFVIESIKMKSTFEWTSVEYTTDDEIVLKVLFERYQLGDVDIVLARNEKKQFVAFLGIKKDCSAQYL